MQGARAADAGFVNVSGLHVAGCRSLPHICEAVAISAMGDEIDAVGMCITFYLRGIDAFLRPQVEQAITKRISSPTRVM